MNKIKAVLFDMDGVLVDAKEWHYLALNRALELFGTSISRYDHLNTYDGLPTSKKLEILSKEKNLPRSLHGFINSLKQKYTIELVFNNCRPTFRHQYLFSWLKRSGLKIAVCSNSIHGTIDLMMRKTDLHPYLDLVLSNEDVAKAKPDPEIYLTAIKRFQLSSAECLIVEDNPHGLEAARKSGCHVLQVENVDEVNFDNISRRIRNCESSVL